MFSGKRESNQAVTLMPLSRGGNLVTPYGGRAIYFPAELTMKPTSSPLSKLRHGVLVMVGFVLVTGQVAVAGDAPDLDGDGVPNIVDTDVDNDGIPNKFDNNVDGGIARSGPFAGQYLGDHLRNDNPAEKDIDGDGLSDDSLGETDIDGDGTPDEDPAEEDIDGDGRSDDASSERDIDGDGRRDEDLNEDDIDGDGLDDDDPLEDDVDGDNLTDDIDTDIDGDGLLNGDAAETDTDGDGREDEDPEEDDVDSDGILDRDDPDNDSDGVPDEDDLDHVGDPDEVEVEVKLTATAAVPAAPAESEAVVSFQQLGTGKAELKVEVHGLLAGNYELVVDGVVRGTIAMVVENGEVEGVIEFETSPIEGVELLLDFAASGLPISVRQGGADYFTGTVPIPPAP